MLIICQLHFGLTILSSGAIKVQAIGRVVLTGKEVSIGLLELSFCKVRTNFYRYCTIDVGSQVFYFLG